MGVTPLGRGDEEIWARKGGQIQHAEAEYGCAIHFNAANYGPM